MLAPVVGTLNVHELVLSGPADLLDGPLREAADRVIRARTMAVSCEGLIVRTSTLGTTACWSAPPSLSSPESWACREAPAWRSCSPPSALAALVARYR